MKLSLILAAITLPLTAIAAPAPYVSAGDLSQPLPKPYQDGADAKAQIDAALAQAKISGKQVLIDMGANWCPDCRVLAGVMAIPKVKGFVAENYEVVYVDVGRFNKNMDLPARFGGAKPMGIPDVLVVTPQGVLVNPTQREDLDNDRSMAPQQIADWLARWVKPTT